MENIMKRLDINVGNNKQQTVAVHPYVLHRMCGDDEEGSEISEGTLPYELEEEVWDTDESQTLSYDEMDTEISDTSAVDGVDSDDAGEWVLWLCVCGWVGG